MSSKNDPIGNTQAEQLAKSDLFIANAGLPEVVGLIEPADLATATTDNTNMHRDKLASDQADAAAQEATRVKNTTFGDAERNMRGIRQRIINKVGYTKAAGEILGLERTESSNPSFADDGPVAELLGKPGATGGAELKGKKNGADAMDIYSKRDGDADFVFLMRVLRFPWTDKRTLLVAGKPESRQYYGQFVIRGEPAGQRSPIITVIVSA